MNEIAPPPTARTRPIRRNSFAWLVPVAAFVFVLAFVFDAWGASGPLLLLTADEGHGIGAGDPLLHRGIVVGRVERVELTGDLGAVELSVRLDPAAETLARAGSRFWIARPDIGIDRIRGIDTLLGGRHLEVLPGNPDAPTQREFVCLDEIPVRSSQGEDALEFVLEAQQRYGLAPGAPVTYRQVEIGNVVAVALATDAGSVEVRCRVRAPYAQLVREDSVFWETGGFRASFELIDGIDVDVESLRSLLVGGLTMATPTRPGPPARMGSRFPLHAEPKEEWLAWRPSLPIGSELLPRGTPVPRLLRARLVWEQGLFDRRQSRAGWVLTLPGGVIGPAELFTPPADGERVALELRGERLPLESAPTTVVAGVARLELVWRDVVKWPKERVRLLAEPEDCLVVADPGMAPTALAASRFLEPEADDDAPVIEGAWSVHPAVGFDEGWHGAAVLARSDGALVGLLLVDDGRGTVVPVVAFAN